MLAHIYTPSSFVPYHTHICAHACINVKHECPGEEIFDVNALGTCKEVSEERVGDGELLYFRGCASGSACTIVLRGM